MCKAQYRLSENTVRRNKNVRCSFKPVSPPEREVKKVYDRKLRFGIIGTGWIAESHVECLKEMEDVEIAAGADLIPGKAEAFSSVMDWKGCIATRITSP